MGITSAISAIAELSCYWPRAVD